jgi:hypothetical protein
MIKTVVRRVIITAVVRRVMTTVNPTAQSSFRERLTTVLHVG